VRWWTRLKENWGYKILALLLAAVLWFFVLSEQNPLDIVERSLPLRVINLPAGLVPMDMPEKVKVRLRAPREILERLEWETLQATLDARDQKAGRHPLPVRVDVPPSVQILGIEPEMVLVLFDQWVQRTIPVEIRITGLPHPDYTYDPNPVVTPEQVTASGPSREVVQVWRARGEVDVTDAVRDVEKSIWVWPIDLSGRRVSNVNLEPATVHVHVRITRRRITRTVRLVPRVEGSPAPGYSIGKISVNPTTVSVQGDHETVAQLEYLNTAPVNVEGATQTVEQEVPVEVPRGVEVLGGNPFRARVRVEIRPTPEAPVSLPTRASPVRQRYGEERPP
jgi:YbbR domain-containing protein